MGSPCECAAGRDRGGERRARRGDRCLSCAAPRGRGGGCPARFMQRFCPSTEPCPARNHVASARHIKQREGWSGAEKHRNRRRRLTAHQASQKPLSQRMPIAVDYTRPPRQQRCSREREPIILIAKASCAHFFCKRCKDKRQSKKDLPRAPQQTPPPCTQPCAQSL